MPYPTLTEAPDYNAEVAAKPAVDIVQFGDGYAQDILKGINNLPETFNLSFKRSPDDATAIYNWFKTNRARFFWTPPDETQPKLWTVISDIRKAYDNAGWWRVTVTLEQRFDPDIP